MEVTWCDTWHSGILAWRAKTGQSRFNLLVVFIKGNIMKHYMGMKVIWLQTSMANCNEQIIAEGTITKMAKDTLWVDSKHKGEDCLYAAFAWPDTSETRTHLQADLDMAKRHKQERTEFLSKTFKLANSYC